MKGTSVSTLCGSPPHAWGHFCRRLAEAIILRFTPTRVGTFLSQDSGYSNHTVHPHTRGDITTVAYGTSEVYGSPPHAWGHSGPSSTSPSLLRFTPTRVGTFCRWRPSSPPISVHPHTRGDIASIRTMACRLFGSPPHAWGHFDLPSFHRPSPRFTPTRVGTFLDTISSRVARSVHPHTRGDIGVRRVDVTWSYGSPPHAWGHSVTPGYSAKHWRFTPTRVGTLVTAAEMSSSTAVHPHTRGDIVFTL